MSSLFSGSESRVLVFVFFSRFDFFFVLTSCASSQPASARRYPPKPQSPTRRRHPHTVSRTLMCVRRTHERVHWQVVRSNPVGCETLVQAPLPPFGPCPYPKRPLAVFPSLVLLPPSSSLQFPHCILLTFYTLPFYILTFSRIVLASFISVFRATSDS